MKPDPFLLNQIKLTHEHIVTIAKIERYEMAHSGI